MDGVGGSMDGALVGLVGGVVAVGELRREGLFQDLCKHRQSATDPFLVRYPAASTPAPTRGRAPCGCATRSLCPVPSPSAAPCRCSEAAAAAVAVVTAASS